MKKIIQSTLTISSSLLVFSSSLNAEFIRIDSKDVVVDTSKNLMWQDAPYTKEEKKAYDDDKNYGKAGNWEYAKEYCQNLNFAGYDDWYLPNKEELISIVDKANNPTIVKGFQNIGWRNNSEEKGGNYWSSTSYASDTSNVWYVVFAYGTDLWGKKTYSAYVRCVRAGQSFDPLTLQTSTTGKLKKDRVAPTISITSPSTSRALKKSNESRVQILGNATDSSGIAEVTINGTMATIDANGNFSGEAFLKIGENTLLVSATDTFGNTASKSITVVREGGVVAQKTDATLGNVGRYKALLIGVENYQDKNIKSLDNPIKDAIAFDKILKNNYGFETVVLKNPTRAEIIKAFDTIRKELSKNDSLLIFYAGHGHWDEEDKLGYWLPANAKKDDTAEWLPNSSIKDQLSRIKTKHTLLVADACFGGGIFKTRKAFDDDRVASELYKLPSRKAMTSGTLKEVPDESIFMKYLLKRLEENKNSTLSAGGLFGSMRDAVINNNSLGLVPQYGEVNGAGDEGGDFIFVRR
jgi:hypothetical protein